MKTLILTAALPLLACVAQAQETPPVKESPPESVKKAKPAVAWLGIGLTDKDGKAVITGIAPESPAAKAGLQEGDILLRIGDAAVEGNIDRVVKSVAEKQPGDAIALHWRRGDEEGTAKIELAARPEPPDTDFRGEFNRFHKEKTAETPDKLGDVEEKLKKLREEAEHSLREAARASKDALEKAGENLEKLKEKTELDASPDKFGLQKEKEQSELKLEKVEPEKSREAKEQGGGFLGVAVEPGPDGTLTVTGVVPESPAAKAGLQKGDIILNVGGTSVKDDVKGFVGGISAKNPGETVDLTWRRDGKEATATIELGKRPHGEDEGAIRFFELKPDPNHPDKQLRFYLDNPWKLRREEDAKFRDLARGQWEERTTKNRRENEDEIWNRVHKSIAAALDKTDIGPDLREKIMQSIEDARRFGSAEAKRRAQLEHEAAKLEKEMQSLKDRADKVREELKKAEQ